MAMSGAVVRIAGRALKRTASAGVCTHRASCSVPSTLFSPSTPCVHEHRAVHGSVFAGNASPSTAIPDRLSAPHAPQAVGLPMHTAVETGRMLPVSVNSHDSLRVTAQTTASKQRTQRWWQCTDSHAPLVVRRSTDNKEVECVDDTQGTHPGDDERQNMHWSPGLGLVVGALMATSGVASADSGDSDDAKEKKEDEKTKEEKENESKAPFRVLTLNQCRALIEKESTILKPGPNSGRHVVDEIHVCRFAAHDPFEDALDASMNGGHAEGVLLVMIDGHTGDRVSNIARKFLLDSLKTEYVKAKERDPDGIVPFIQPDGFIEVDIKLIMKGLESMQKGVIEHAHATFSGASATVLHFVGTRLTAGVVGHVRTFICKKLNSVKALELNIPHTVQDNDGERARIAMEHPTERDIFEDGLIKGWNPVTRELGNGLFKHPAFMQTMSPRQLEHMMVKYGTLELQDFTGQTHKMPDFQPPYTTAEPEILNYDLMPSDRYVIVSTSGLWDFVRPDEAAKLVDAHHERVARGQEVPYQNAAAMLMEVALERIGRKAVLDVVSRSGQPAPEPRRRNMDLSVALQLEPKHRPKVHEDLCVAVVKLHNWEAVSDAPLEQQQQVVKPPTALTTLASQQD